MLNVIKNRYIYIWISFLFVLFSLFMIFFRDLNLWIDMTWWTQWEYSYSSEINLDEIINKLEKEKDVFNAENNNIINWLSIYSIYWEKKIVIETWFNNIYEEKTLENYKNSWNELVFKTLNSENNNFTLSKYVNIWKSFWDYIKKTAWMTLIIALIAISIYIAFAFFWVAVWISSWAFAWVTLLTLFHDVIVASWFYIFSWIFFVEFKVDTFFITALLTILGYSINDTIVVFDRIRENIKKYVKSKKLDEIINISINETLARSIFTSLTLMFVLIAIFFFGPEALKWFILTLIYWVAFWTYSSIFIAAPILYEINKNTTLKVYEKKVVSDDDKLVV